jgi:hypothetical protein
VAEKRDYDQLHQDYLILKESCRLDKEKDKQDKEKLIKDYRDLVARINSMSFFSRLRFLLSGKLG